MRAFLQSGYYHRIKVVDGNQAVLGLCLGNYPHRFILKRPVVHPFYTPKGVPVTEMGAHNFPNIRGIWVAHAALNDINFYHEYDETGWIVPTDWSIDDAGPEVGIDMTLDWRDPRGEVIALEARTYRVSRSETGYVLDIGSALTPHQEVLRLAPDMHGFMGVRVIDAIDEDDGGQMLSSEGGTTEATISWEQSERPERWVNYSGQIGDHSVGIAAMFHPDISPAPVYARGYGVFFLNPQSEEIIEVPIGESFPFAARFYAYDGAPNASTFEALWRDFGNQPLTSLV